MTDEVIADLASRRKKIVDQLLVNVKVDHWDDDGEPPVYVKYAPVPQAMIDEAMAKIAETNDYSEKLDLNAGILVAACRGVYQKVDGKAVGFDGKEGNLPKFDSDLAKILGIPGDPPPTMVCRQLFFVEGNILAHVGEVAVLSGQKMAEVDTELLGK